MTNFSWFVVEENFNLKTLGALILKRDFSKATFDL